MNGAARKAPGLLASLQRAEERALERERELERSRPAPSRYQVPPVLYLPVTAGPSGNIAEVRPTREGRRALLAYSALDRLLAQCGDGQPWVLVQIADLDGLMAEQPFDLIAFDANIPPGMSENGRLS